MQESGRGGKESVRGLGGAWRIFVAGAVACVWMVTAGQSVGAALTWSTTTLPAVPPDSASTGPPSLRAVSCVSATFCVAVGTVAYPDLNVANILGGAFFPEAEILSGTTWTATALPQLPGGSVNLLTGVSCVSAAFCVAVGDYYQSGGGLAPLAEIDSDGTWSVTALPTPPGFFWTSGPFGAPELAGVSCVSTVSCTAVGMYPTHTGNDLLTGYSYFPMAETLSGTTWKASRLPVPAPTDISALSGVSCVAGRRAPSCEAVGNSAGFPMVDRLAGGHWTAARLPLPTGASYLQSPWSVSCPAPGWCEAFGQDALIDGFSGLVADTLVDGTWASTAIPLPAGYTVEVQQGDQQSGGLSCGAPGECVGVNLYSRASDGAQSAIAVSLQDGVWTTSFPPSPPSVTLTWPYAVSCVASASCVAVGYAATSPLPGPAAEVLSDGTWGVELLPWLPDVDDNWMTGISCPTSTRCFAVGNASPGEDEDLIAETLANGVWTSSVLPLPADAAVLDNFARPFIGSISCPTALFCVAVGAYSVVKSKRQRPLAEVYSNGTWQAVALPQDKALHTGPLDGAGLSGISCVSTTSCVAVGTYQEENYLLVETLSGETWTAKTLRRPAHVPRVALSSVSCVAATSCMAVGAYWAADPTFSRPLAARLTGTKWRLQGLSVPPDGSSNVAFTYPMLNAVSCPSDDDCVAVGSYPTGPVDAEPLTETFDGTGWQAGTAATAGPATFSQLWGVSCDGPGSCVAAGDQDGNPLVESLATGTWTPEILATPDGETAASLQAVSCPEAGSCVAIGSGIGEGGVDPVTATE